MGLNWNWNEKCGEINVHRNFRGEEFDFSVNLYKGNAFLIMLSETENNFEMYGFFSDDVHMKRCFGIDKKWKNTYGSNMYNDDMDKWTKVRISRNYPYLKKFVSALVEAFPAITIEVYEDSENA